jgi:hypothetical protein
MRLLFPSALLLCAIGAVAWQAPPQQTSPPPRDRTKQQRGSDNKAGNSQPLPNAPVPTAENQPAPAKKEQDSEEKTQSILKKALAPETWANWALFFAAVGTAVVALKTLKAIQHEAEEARVIAEAARDNATAARDGAEAANKNAEAASLNAQAVINAERAWIVINVTTTTNPGEYICRVLNYGRTPAALTAQQVGFIFPTKEEEIPQVIKANKYVVPAFADPIVVAPGGDRVIDLWTIGRELRGDKLQGAHIGKNLVIYFGMVLYRDILGIEHITKFCYRMSPKEGTMSICGPKGCNEYT